MKLTTLALSLLLGVSLSHPAPLTYCSVTVLRDYDLIWAYHARLVLDKSCALGIPGRVRKVSTTSTRLAGAPYQPIRPETGAWTVDERGDNVPAGLNFTLNSWRWEYWQDNAWHAAVTR